MRNFQDTFEARKRSFISSFSICMTVPLTKNDYTVKDSFQLAEEICEQDPTLYMGSLDVDSLFTNIPLDETIDISVNQLFENSDTVEGFTSQNLHNYYVWLQRSLILYLTVYFTNKLMV